LKKPHAYKVGGKKEIHTSRRQRFTAEVEETAWIQNVERKIIHTLRRQRDTDANIAEISHTFSFLLFLQQMWQKTHRLRRESCVSSTAAFHITTGQDSSHFMSVCIYLSVYFTIYISQLWWFWADKRWQKMTDKNTAAELHSGSSNEAAGMGNKSQKIKNVGMIIVFSASFLFLQEIGNRFVYR
jgi:hypothetical protein